MNYNDLSPMMKQYHEAKREAGDALLLFRMGDFYELFYEDAHTVATALGIAVTTRERNKGPDATPMAGFPWHQLEGYLAKLITLGYKVAVCEQMEDPKLTKKIVKRKVVRIVTPGTVIDETILNPRRSNYLAAVVPGSTSTGTRAGIAWVELSTGEFFATSTGLSEVADFLGTISPAELLLPESLKGAGQQQLHLLDTTARTWRPDWNFSSARSLETLKKQFHIATLEGLGFQPDVDILPLAAAGAILDYLNETQKQSLEHIETLRPHHSGAQLEMDDSTRRSLEILQTIREGRREGSLLSILDNCQTSMGSRLLAHWLTFPLTNLHEIETRQNAVAELIDRESFLPTLCDKLRMVYDLQRILAKMVQQRAIPRDLLSINRTLSVLPDIKEFLSKCSSSLLRLLDTGLDTLEPVCEELTAAFKSDSPLNYREGGFIQDGYSEKLDKLRQLQSGGKQWLATYQAEEIQRTGIPTLKVGYTSVFGYYIEVTHLNSVKIPDNYIRKQTLKNAERYITPELKEYEEAVLTADEQAKQLEMEILGKLLAQVLSHRATMQRIAGILANLDVLVSLATIAHQRGYRRPLLVAESILEIQQGRHPVLDLSLGTGTFVPNDARCNDEQGMIHLITGPNMAGKSTFIRQVALLAIMSQIGSFLPVASATIGICDRIFARVGASDELNRGQSTFMVEMIETARILNGATEKSLVILDEIGRGTSTYDGISLAWAIVESLLQRIGCRTFFATHYHELTGLADTYEGINNLNVAIREWNEEIVFLHKIIPGAADKSYGIHVARLAGVPQSVILRSQELLAQLEDSHLKAAQDTVRTVLQNAALPGELETEPEEVIQTVPTSLQLQKTGTGSIQFSLFGPEDHPIVEELRAMNINHLTPIEALALLEKWKKKI